MLAKKKGHYYFVGNMKAAATMSTASASSSVVSQIKWKWRLVVGWGCSRRKRASFYTYQFGHTKTQVTWWVAWFSPSLPIELRLFSKMVTASYNETLNVNPYLIFLNKYTFIGQQNCVLSTFRSKKSISSKGVILNIAIFGYLEEFIWPVCITLKLLKN